jgi:polyphosphate kinase
MAKIVNKEISWLSFNARVLQEAADPSTPLLERLKFLAIFSSNLDEFYRVRVATLKRLARLGKKAKRIIGHHPYKVLREIQDIVLCQNRMFDRVFRALLKDLAHEGIHIVNERRLNAEQRRFVSSYFREEVRPKLIPLMIDQVREFPSLRDRSIFLAVRLGRSSNPRARALSLIEIPSHILPRFVILPAPPGHHSIMFLDDIVRFGLDEIFSVLGYDRFEAYTIKLTRDAELDIDQDVSESVIKKVAESLKHRKQGNPVRFIYDSRLPASILSIFTAKLGIDTKDSLIPGGRYHNFKDFMKFPDFGMDGLRYPREPKLIHPDLSSGTRIFEAVARRDILLHFAYQAFDHVIDLLREASIDPHVLSIKMTIYRVAPYSSILNSLIIAAKNGKTVLVVLELQARFDEKANIAWADRLREAGVRVLFGVQGLKVHAKTCLITRRERNRDVLYAVLGTGNFNEDTARIYSDHALFTADRRLTEDVAGLFDFFEKPYKPAEYQSLIISPFSTRKRILKLIDREGEAAAQGQDAWLTIKANNLTDPEIIEALLQSAHRGARVRLIIRSMFSMPPPSPRERGRIEVRSIVDRYLEHSRIFAFGNNNHPLVFLSSADLMPRNLEGRIECTFPVLDSDAGRQLLDFLEIQFRDNVKARRPNQAIVRRPTDPAHAVRAQWAIPQYLKSGDLPPSRGCSL